MPSAAPRTKLLRHVHAVAAYAPAASVSECSGHCRHAVRLVWRGCSLYVATGHASGADVPEPQ